jgi:rubrerythrin
MPLLRTSLLMSEPAGTLKSLDELFALASAMEEEAANRYAELAEDMRRQNKGSLAEVFAQLADAEREHVASVARWSQSRRSKAPDPALVRWKAPKTFDAETASEIGASRLATPYRALAMAVRNEERAFAFWSYVAAYSRDLEIKQAAEAMAREELGHISTLRKERRRAYHKEHEETGRRGRGDAGVMEVDARALELRLASLLADLERGLGGTAATRTRELLAETMQMSGKTAGIGKFSASLAQMDAEAISEALADAYLEAAESSGDQTQVALLQGLAESAIARLAWLRSLLTPPSTPD